MIREKLASTSRFLKFQMISPKGRESNIKLNLEISSSSSIGISGSRTIFKRPNRNESSKMKSRNLMEMSDSRLKPALTIRIESSLLLVALLFHSAPLLGAQCPVNTMTSFEQISGVTVKSSLLKELYTAPNVSIGSSASPFGAELTRQLSAISGAGNGGGSNNNNIIPITAECNNRCRRSVKCRAFLVDYGRHVCYSIESPLTSPSSLLNQGSLVRAPAPIHLEPTQDRTSYFEKVCLNLPSIECERAWVYERVLAHQLIGHDDKVIEEVPSRIKCQEYCLNELEFRCRSGEYDYLTMQCRLSISDRHMKPLAFKPTSSNIDYFENQCVSVGNQCDAFDRFDDMDIGRAEIMRPANTSDQCQQICTQTIKAFICRSFTWSASTGKCYLNSVNSFMIGGLNKLVKAPGLTYYQRNDCIDLKLECDTSAMTLNLKSNEPFRGRMYVRDEPNSCESSARSSGSSLVSSLSIPFQSGNVRCASRESPSRYSSVVVVQQHPLIQRKSDRYIKVVCDFQTANTTITSTYNVVANPWTSTALINSTSFAPKIKLRITDKFGIDVTGAKLGDELYLRIEAETDSVYDMVARSVLAKSGANHESIVLIDKDGCPTDFRIFPSLKKLNRRTIIGKFDAFKFSSDVVVRFQVDVQFCLNQCPSTTCDYNNLSLLNSHQMGPGGSQANVDHYSSMGQLAAGSQKSLSTSAPARAVTAASSSTTTESPSTQTSLFDTATGSAASTHLPAASDHYFTEQHRTQSNFSSLAKPPYFPSGASSANGNARPAPENPPAHLQPNELMINSLLSGGDAQLFEARMGLDGAPAKGARGLARPGDEVASFSDQSSDQNNLRRRRRSVEPMPEAPRHVPLQREIIVEGSAPAPSSEASGNNPTQGNKSKRARASSQRDDAKRVDDPLRLQSNFANGNEKLNNNLDQPAALLCTTRNSLVFASLAFCTIQILTMILCLVIWVHRKDVIRFKVKHRQTENRFC